MMLYLYNPIRKSQLEYLLVLILTQFTYISVVQLVQHSLILLYKFVFVWIIPFDFQIMECVYIFLEFNHNLFKT